MTDSLAGHVEGVHRVQRKTLWWLMGAVTVLQAVNAVYTLLSGHTLAGLLYAAVATLFVTALLEYRSERTLVAPDGIRVKRGLRWRTVAWDDVADVAKPERWTWDRTLRITTQSGEDVRLDVPGALRSDFVAYANVHRRSSLPAESSGSGVGDRADDA
jgi:hypothetical protein